jgi:uncharacterized membrane protein YsdA (DUF1294 family)
VPSRGVSWLFQQAAKPVLPATFGAGSELPRQIADKLLKPAHLSTFDTLAAVWFGILNAASFLAFGCDKWKASCGRWRVPEFSLLLLALLGGWPGGWLGMKVFKHKTAKPSFQLKYVLAVIPFVAEVWGWLHWR